MYVLYAGLRGRTGKGVCVTGGVVAGEVLVFAGNGFRYPLTELAERADAAGRTVDQDLLSWLRPGRVTQHL